MTRQQIEEKLTAYALGELESKEKKLIEEALRNDADLRKQLEDIQLITGTLRQELTTEPVRELSAAQRKRIAQAAEPKSREWFNFGLVFAPAAAVIIGGVIVLKLANQAPQNRNLPAEVHDPLRPVALEPSVRQPTTEERVASLRDDAPEPAKSKPVAAKEKNDKGERSSIVTKNAPAPQLQAEQLGALGKGRVGALSEGAELKASAASGAAMDSMAGAPVARQAMPMTPDASRKRYAGVRYEEEALMRHAPPPMGGYAGGYNTESYAAISDNPFRLVNDEPLSTFSIDVDTASYANLRRFLNSGANIPKDAVRIEEMINYFDYSYRGPTNEHPFAVHVEVAQAPWQAKHRLVRIGIKGREIDWAKRPASNLVFLIDVSGSMSEPNKLPLVQESLKLLTRKLGEQDRIAIVVYAGSSGLVLPSTHGNEKSTILEALDRLQAGGSTNGGQGIELAYRVAQENFIAGGTNRVVLATDGDFNVGITDQGSLVRLIEEKAKSGVFLSVLGFGTGNYKDSTMEQLADKGNGNYAYIDTLNEGRKVLVDQAAGTLMTIAKDVKIQVEFNPAEVQAFRLIGYENRILAHQDFNDDTKDAGEIGAGHTVTALYEVVPKGVEFSAAPGIDPLKYQKPKAAPEAGTTEPSDAASNGELLTIKLRYKEPSGSKSKLIVVPVQSSNKTWEQASIDFKFQAAVASFGMILRDSPHKGDTDLGMVLKMAKWGLGDDANGYRAEFITLVHKAKGIVDSN